MKLENTDRYKQLIVIAFFRIDGLYGRLALKGGNAIDLFYPEISGRGSIDVDFSLRDELTDESMEQIQREIERELTDVFKSDDLSVFDFNFIRRPKDRHPDAPLFWNGYKLEFKVLSTDKFNDSKDNFPKLQKMGYKCKVDISHWEYIDSSESRELEGSTVVLYTAPMIVSEKLRAICQQMKEYTDAIGTSNRSGRSRDFFDIHQILTNTSIDLCLPENMEILENIFKAKDVPLELLEKVSENKEIHEVTFPELRDTVKRDVDLKDFDYYFNYVVALVEKLCHALGNK
jgi:predicted nucleotidyltransferase component of viral defense system